MSGRDDSADEWPTHGEAMEQLRASQATSRNLAVALVEARAALAEAHRKLDEVDQATDGVEYVSTMTLERILTSSRPAGAAATVAGFGAAAPVAPGSNPGQSATPEADRTHCSTCDRPLPHSYSFDR